MPQKVRRRFWLELVSGSITGCFAVVTLLWYDWIETVFGVDPDRGNGSMEWLVFAIFAFVTLILALGARLEWRRAQVAETLRIVAA
jgi:hypothetical protein